MNTRFRLALGTALAGLLASNPVLATNVIMQTPLGDIEIELFDEQTPKTVVNFLNYVTDGDYKNSFVHRKVTDFVIQGGGFRFIDDAVDLVPADDPVENEPGLSNVRGTIAMAKISGDPNSATSQWFINVEDNSAELDNQNGGFTVFGKVVGGGMAVVDAINELQAWNAGGSFTALPLINYPGSGLVTDEYLVMMDMHVVNDFVINAGVNDAWFNLETAGQGFFIVVFPLIKKMFVAMFTFDTERPANDITAVLGEPGHRWFTAFGDYDGHLAELDIEITSGGIFDSAEPVPGQVTDGTLTVDFTDCANATISYDITSIDRQGVIPVQRLAADNIALCEALAVN